jgi:eukaryotic-like serine/threonine-protein kinase
MPLTQVADLIGAIRSLQLLPQQQMDALVRQQATFPDARKLAKKLVDLKWLTAYQARLLLNNKGRDLILGQYVLLDKLGEGGMGQVFKARKQRTDRLVALKVIRKERLARADIVRRFEREVRLAGQLSHPNVVAAIDADTVGETLMFVMEFVDGVNLSVLVKKSGPLPVAQACDFIRQAASGLAHAHEKGVIHRDIKPSNLFVTQSAEPGSRNAKKSSAIRAPGSAMVKILDMGLARIGEGEGDNDSAMDLTVEGQVVGTPDYIAPEQMIDARSVDHRADLYALGCTFYYLLTGSVPFPGGSLGEKLLKHQLHHPRAIDQFRTDVPPAVIEVVNRLMAKRPEDRFQAASEVVAILSGSAAPPMPTAPVAVIVPDIMVQPDAAPAAIPLDPFSTTPVAGGSSTLSSGRRLGHRADRRWLYLGVGAGMMFALLVAGVLAILFQVIPPDSSRDTRPATTRPTP